MTTKWFVLEEGPGIVTWNRAAAHRAHVLRMIYVYLVAKHGKGGMPTDDPPPWVYDVAQANGWLDANGNPTDKYHREVAP